MSSHDEGEKCYRCGVWHYDGSGHVCPTPSTDRPYTRREQGRWNPKWTRARMAEAIKGFTADRECWHDGLLAAYFYLTESCRWTEDEDGMWAAACGPVWAFEWATPAANGITYCHHCGRTVVAVAFQEKTDECSNGRTHP